MLHVVNYAVLHVEAFHEYLCNSHIDCNFLPQNFHGVYLNIIVAIHSAVASMVVNVW